MKRTCALFLLLAFMATLAACRPEPLFPGTPRYLRMQDRYRYLMQSGGVSVSDSAGAVAPPPSVYYTALAFPDWAEWREGDLRGAEVVLYKDGEEQLRVPIGDNPDPERHRVRGGHLWTDHIEGRETVVECDGQEVLRYSGEEVLMGFLLVGEHLHTIGQLPGGQGFTYRIDGKEVFGDPADIVVGSLNRREWEGGALMADSLYGVCYSYGVPFRSGDKTEWEYRTMSGDSCLKKMPKGTSERLFDIRVYRGEVYRTEQRGADATTICLVQDNNYHSIDIQPAEVPHLLELVPLENGQMGVKGYSNGLVRRKKVFWYRDAQGLHQQVSSYRDIPDLFVEGERLAYCTTLEGVVQEAFQDGRSLEIAPNTYRLATPLCARLHQGRLLLLLSSVEGNDHLVLHGDTRTPFTFNGYFTSIVIAP